MKRIILTGGHGVGKTSTLLALEELGEHVVFEAAAHVRRLGRARGVAFPDDFPGFESSALACHLARECAVGSDVSRVFLDRGAPDHLAYSATGHWQLAEAEIEACRGRRYDHVFLLEGPPGRPSTLDRVEAAFSQRLVAELIRIYTELGMPPQPLIWEDVDRRAEMILTMASDTLE